MEPNYLLGLDGGNTKTIALVARIDGMIVGWGRAGCSDIYNTTAAGALAAVSQAVQTALRHAHIEQDAIQGGCFSMAGADWLEDFVFLQAALRERGFGRTITVVNDAMGALRAGTADNYGVVIACGTGAAIGARARDGRSWHTSHWQELGGSDYLRQCTLRAIYRADLGIDPPTTLTAPVLAIFGQTRVEDLLHLLTTREGTRPDDAGQVARILLDEAQRGDPTARRIARKHGQGLGEYALAAARRVGIAQTAFPMVLTGGVFRHPSPLFSQAVVDRVRAEIPSIAVTNSRFEPAVGALLLALEAAHVEIDELLLARLTASLPPHALFAT